MERSQQVSRYQQLEEELIAAYTAEPCDRATIERLTDELAELQRRLRYPAPPAAPPSPPDDEASVDVLLD